MNDDHVAQLTTRVSAALGEWLGPGATLASPAPRITRLKQSFFIRYIVRTPDGTSKTLIVKIPRQPGMATLDQAIAATQLYAATRREYDSLVAVADALIDASPAHFCIRPFAYLSGWNAIVMQEEPTQSLKQILLRPRMMLNFDRDWAPFENALTGAGKWLKLFHARLGDAQIETLDAHALQNEIDEEWARLDRATHRVLDLSDLRGEFIRAIASIAGTDAIFVTLHGDFNCGNILATRDGRVGAIDTKRRTRGPIEIDLAMLATDPLTRKIQVVSHGMFIRQHRLVRCQNALLTGYFGSHAPDVRVLNFYSARTVVRKWTLDEEMLASAQGMHQFIAPLIAAQARAYFKNVLQRLLACFT